MNRPYRSAYNRPREYADERAERQSRGAAVRDAKKPDHARLTLQRGQPCKPS